MDSFTLIILLALIACVALHLFARGPGHRRGESDRGRGRAGDEKR